MLDPWGWALIASTLGAGLVSALTVVVPIEAVVVSVAATQPSGTAVTAAVAAAVGQTIGKVVILVAVRGTKSARWLPSRLRRRTEREAVVAAGAADPGTSVGAALSWESPGPGAWFTTHRWRLQGRVQALRRGLGQLSTAGVTWLGGRWAPMVVVLSGALGLPPLLLMSVAAGLSGMSVARFAGACLVGRSLRFLTLVSVPGLATAML